MELLELTSQNIDQYVGECVSLQAYLVSDPTAIQADRFVETAKSSTSYLVAVIDSEAVVGLGLVSCIVHPVNVTGYINNIVVAPESRGQGLFSVIMDELERYAKDVWRCSDLALTCSRPEVQKMYEKRGYEDKATAFYLKKL